MSKTTSVSSTFCEHYSFAPRPGMPGPPPSLNASSGWAHPGPFNLKWLSLASPASIRFPVSPGTVRFDINRGLLLRLMTYPLYLVPLTLPCKVFSLLTLAVAKIVFKMERKKVFCSFLDQVALIINVHPIPVPLAISPPPLKDACQSIQLYIMTQSDFF